jgi:hypothetical protein
MKVDLSMLDLNKTNISIHEMNNVDININNPSYILKVERNGIFTTSMTMLQQFLQVLIFSALSWITKR